MGPRNMVLLTLISRIIDRSKISKYQNSPDGGIRIIVYIEKEPSYL